MMTRDPRTLERRGATPLRLPAVDECPHPGLPDLRHQHLPVPAERPFWPEHSRNAVSAESSGHAVRSAVIQDGGHGLSRHLPAGVMAWTLRTGDFVVNSKAIRWENRMSRTDRVTA